MYVFYNHSVDQCNRH